MKELISQIVSNLNVDKGQAEGGVGALFKLAQDNLGSGDFSKLSEMVPGLKDMISSAPNASGETADSGMMGMIGGAISAMTGNNSLTGLASLAGSFKTLNLDAGMVMKFAPIVLNFVKENGGEVAQTLLNKAIGGK